MTTQHSVDLHASRGELVLVIAIVFPILATLIVLLRVYTRFILLKTPALDDAFTIIALVSCLRIRTFLSTNAFKIFSVGSSISQGFGKIEIK